MGLNDAFSNVLKSKKAQLFLIGGGSFAIGVAVGYFSTNRLLEKRYEELVAKEREDAKTYYQRRDKTGIYSDPVALARKHAPDVAVVQEGEGIVEFEERVMQEAKEHLKELKYGLGLDDDGNDVEEQTPEEKLEVQESIKHNIFDGRAPVEDDGFDLEAEKETRDEAYPYIISHDEFYLAELDFGQNTLTYFQGDKVLVDEADTPIANVRKTIGEDNIKFGYGSKDENIVYIRNHQLEVDFEVVRSFGKYAEEVLGFIEHAEKPKLRKFRNFD